MGGDRTRECNGRGEMSLVEAALSRREDGPRMAGTAPRDGCLVRAKPIGASDCAIRCEFTFRYPELKMSLAIGGTIHIAPNVFPPPYL